MSSMYMDENEADIFTKNIAAPVFDGHIPKFVVVDKYMEERYFKPVARVGVGAQFSAPDSDNGIFAQGFQSNIFF